MFSHHRWLAWHWKELGIGWVLICWKSTDLETWMSQEAHEPILVWEDIEVCENIWTQQDLLNQIRAGGNFLPLSGALSNKLGHRKIVQQLLKDMFFLCRNCFFLPSCLLHLTSTKLSHQCLGIVSELRQLFFFRKEAGNLWKEDLRLINVNICLIDFKSKKQRSKAKLHFLLAPQMICSRHHSYHHSFQRGNWIKSATICGNCARFDDNCRPQFKITAAWNRTSVVAISGPTLNWQQLDEIFEGGGGGIKWKGGIFWAWQEFYHEHHLQRNWSQISILINIYIFTFLANQQCAQHWSKPNSVFKQLQI